MGNTDNTEAGTWERIHGGVREIERLIGQGQYNMAMVKSRQTLEYMVKCLCERNGILETSLLEMIDALYHDGIISQTTCEHYHKIRSIGNKAIHEEDNSAYNANQAHHLLSQEIYTFASDYKDAKAPRTRSSLSSSSAAAGRGESRRSPGHTEPRNGKSEGHRPRAYAKPAFEFRSILKPLILILIIILLLFIIKMIHPAKTSDESTAAAISTESAASETEAETVSSETTLYRTTDTVNIRSNPSTDSERLGVLAPAADIEYLRDYDDKWAVIHYNGQEAYISRDFIQQVSQ